MTFLIILSNRFIDGKQPNTIGSSETQPSQPGDDCVMCMYALIMKTINMALRLQLYSTFVLKMVTKVGLHYISNRINGFQEYGAIARWGTYWCFDPQKAMWKSLY